MTVPPPPPKKKAYDVVVLLINLVSASEAPPTLCAFFPTTTFRTFFDEQIRTQEAVHVRRPQWIVRPSSASNSRFPLSSSRVDFLFFSKSCSRSKLGQSHWPLRRHLEDGQTIWWDPWRLAPSHPSYLEISRPWQQTRSDGDNWCPLVWIESTGMRRTLFKAHVYVEVSKTFSGFWLFCSFTSPGAVLYLSAPGFVFLHTLLPCTRSCEYLRIIKINAPLTPRLSWERLPSWLCVFWWKFLHFNVCSSRGSISHWRCFPCWDMKWKRLQGCKSGQIASFVKHFSFSMLRYPLAKAGSADTSHV